MTPANTNMPLPEALLSSMLLEALKQTLNDFFEFGFLPFEAVERISQAIALAEGLSDAAPQARTYTASREEQ